MDDIREGELIGSLGGIEWAEQRKYTKEDILGAFVAGFMQTSWKFNAGTIGEAMNKEEIMEYFTEEVNLRIEQSGFKSLDYWFGDWDDNPEDEDEG